jgi:hypothetical protein
MSFGRRLLRSSRGVVPVALCALAAHAVIYASFWPSDGEHVYFGWYEPVVVGLGAAAALALAVAALLGHGRERTTRLQRFLPSTDESGAGLAVRTVALARAAVVLLFLQETSERSLASRQLTPASFSPSTWCLALAASAGFALLLVLAGRAGARLIERVLAAPTPVDRVVAAGWPRVPPAPTRRNPLADGRGLRAPPLRAG